MATTTKNNSKSNYRRKHQSSSSSTHRSNAYPYPPLLPPHYYSAAARRNSGYYNSSRRQKPVRRPTRSQTRTTVRRRSSRRSDGGLATFGMVVLTLLALGLLALLIFGLLNTSPAKRAESNATEIVAGATTTTVTLPVTAKVSVSSVVTTTSVAAKTTSNTNQQVKNAAVVSKPASSQSQQQVELPTATIVVQRSVTAAEATLVPGTVAVVSSPLSTPESRAEKSNAGAGGGLDGMLLIVIVIGGGALFFFGGLKFRHWNWRGGKFNLHAPGLGQTDLVRDQDGRLIALDLRRGSQLYRYYVPTGELYRFGADGRHEKITDPQLLLAARQYQRELGIDFTTEGGSPSVKPLSPTVGSSNNMSATVAGSQPAGTPQAAPQMAQQPTPATLTPEEAHAVAVQLVHQQQQQRPTTPAPAPAPAAGFGFAPPPTASSRAEAYDETPFFVVNPALGQDTTLYGLWMEYGDSAVAEWLVPVSTNPAPQRYS